MSRGAVICCGFGEARLRGGEGAWGMEMGKTGLRSVENGKRNAI
jgi:hypothetical protein